MPVYSKLFTRTLHAAPADKFGEANVLLQRAGYFVQDGDGSIFLLRFGARVLRKIADFLETGLTSNGGQQLFLSSGSADEPFTPEGHSLMQHIGTIIRSHKQLPQNIYGFREVSRRDYNTRHGLLAPRNSLVCTGFVISADSEQPEPMVDNTLAIIPQLFSTAGISALPAEGGFQPGTRKNRSAYYFLSNAGSATIALCQSCGYADELGIARRQLRQAAAEPQLAMEKIPTPGAKTIGQLAAYLEIPDAKTAKAVLLVADIPPEKEPVFLFVVIRGDMEMSEDKLMALTGAVSLRPATEEEIVRTGAVPGYASPIGLGRTPGTLIVADVLVTTCANLAAGANEEGYHLLHTNYGRDYHADIVGDITLVREADNCPVCGFKLGLRSAVELASADMLNESESLSYQDDTGANRKLRMTRYAIDLSTLAGCMAEAHHDDAGLKLPPRFAPYKVHIIQMQGKTLDTRQTTADICRGLDQAGIDYLLDDRAESAGVKFNDADLIGCPVRLTIGERALMQGGVELKLRMGGDNQLVPPGEVTGWITKMFASDDSG